MPLSSAIVGQVGAGCTLDVEARWVMAYAAAVGDDLPCYLDTLRPQGVIGHPMIPVSLEYHDRGFATADWGLLPGEGYQGVHAAHELVLHRPVRAGDRITMTSSVIGVEQRRPGAYMVLASEAVDAAGAPVWRSYWGSILRGVQVVGEDRPSPRDPSALPRFDPAARPAHEIPIRVGPLAAHVYEECARMRNPIHTDPVVAKQAGLPGPILQGVATLSFAVSRIVDLAAEGDPTRVRRIGARFAQPVLMPSTIRLRVLSLDDGEVRFDVVNAEGRPTITHGFVDV
jgi:acyl dehydratase